MLSFILRLRIMFANSRIYLAGVTFSTGSNLHEALLRLALHQRLGPMLYAPLPIDSTSNT